MNEIDVSSVIRRLEKADPIFFLPGDDLLGALVPTIAQSDYFDCMMGFFASSSLAEIGPGLASFLRNSDKPMRLVVSPYVSERDQQALREGLLSAESVAERLFHDGMPEADDLARHTLACLAWLIRQKRLDFRVAIQKDGLFHPKVWLLGVDQLRIVFHGSSNLTGAALRRNREQVALARAWMDDNQDKTEQRVRREFETVWHGDDPDCLVVRLPAAIEEKLLSDYGKGLHPTEEDAEHLWAKAKRVIDLAVPPNEQIAVAQKVGFHIPDWLEYETGAFKHQGEAVNAWRGADNRGILAMATGSGKTLTSLIACHKLHDVVGQLLIVIAAPYVPLVQQWCDEVALFGVTPRNLSDGSGPAERRRQIGEAGRSLKLKLSQVEVLVVSHDILTDPEFQSQIARIPVGRVLIADEVHNLGSAGFLAHQPTFFDYRLGLSATPIRQYDPDGTDKLFDYFGRPCFEFTLEQAIGVCLVPYDYYVHRVSLTDSEMNDFAVLSDQIRKLAWKLSAGISDPQLDNLIRKRRLIVEVASNKLAELEELLDRTRPSDLSYELIYATDKAPRQLEDVNRILGNRGVLFHQLTSEETRDRKRTAKILADFQSGGLQVLTAKRVLDEGVNVPQIKRAYILASNTVERQWVQRRGRILRKCDAIGKSHGIIHDFVAMPPADLLGDDDAKQLARGELKRVQEFARLARNFGATDGPIAALEQLQEYAFDLS
ncbi:DEAD/DEAH box helicase family protein [Mesorhizobium australicum]|uniref:DEAD/DEAH box helicase family protein n=1 Tax=Mesorhizobium australicum TaxID=536018 RepID=UPI003337FA97